MTGRGIVWVRRTPHNELMMLGIAFSIHNELENARKQSFEQLSSMRKEITKNNKERDLSEYLNSSQAESGFSEF